jgi:hypothetical protein
LNWYSCGNAGGAVVREEEAVNMHPEAGGGFGKGAQL